MRERLPSVDELSAERPPHRPGSQDSFPVTTDDQAELAFQIMRKIDSDVSALNRNVVKVLERDAEKAAIDTEQEKRLGELEKQMMTRVATKARNWAGFGTILGVIVSAATTTALERCQFVPRVAVPVTTPTR